MSIFSDNFSAILSTVTLAIGSFFGFLGGKKLKKSEEKTKESTANIEIGEAYRLMAEQSNSFMKSLTEKINYQTKEIEGFKGENRDQRKDIRQLRFTIDKITKEKDEYKEMVIYLKVENKNLNEELKKYRENENN